MSRGKLTKWIRALKKLDIPRSWRDIGRERMGFEAVRLLLKAVRGAISQIGRLASGKYRRRGNALQPMLGDGRISERRLRRATQQAERKALIATCAASEDKAAAPDQRRAVGLRRRFSQGAMSSADTNQATAASKQRNWPEAALRWQAVLEALGDRTPARAFVQLCRAHRALGDLDRAEHVIHKGRTRYPDDVSLACEHAMNAAVGRNWPEAIKRWAQVIDKAEDETPDLVFVQLSRAYRHQGELERADDTINRAQSMRPAAVTLAMESAEIAMARRNWPQAVIRWRAVLHQFSDEAPPHAYQKLHLSLRFIGDHEAADSIFEEVIQRSNEISYDEWVLKNDALTDEDRASIRQHLASFCGMPSFSLLMPVSDAKPELLRESLEAVLSQLYFNWQLCAVACVSSSDHILSILKEFARRDPRVKVVIMTDGDTWALTNAALKIATGNWSISVGPEDILSEHALYMVAETINRNADVDIIYSDEDHIDGAGRRSNPFFKSGWSYDLFLGQNMIGRLCAYRTSRARLIDSVPQGFDDWQDWEFYCRIIEATQNAKFWHIPFVLYHKRQTNPTSKGIYGQADVAAQRAVHEHFARTGQKATASPEGHPTLLRIKRELTSCPLTSIVIPTKDQCALLKTCVEGLVTRTSYTPIEIVIVDNGSTEPAAVTFLEELRTRTNVVVIEHPGPFNYARLVNFGVAASSGEICVLLNNDIDVINSDWLTEMVSHAIRSEVGAVGAKLYYENDTVQHGGVILGLGGVARHAHRYFPRKSLGYFGKLRLCHDVSCVTAACLATRRELYNRLGGFNENDLAVTFNDVDFCLRVREAGYAVIWTPHAELYHHEGVSRGPDRTPAQAARGLAERTYMRQRWGSILDSDPFYNPNLSLKTEAFSLAAKSRAEKPWSVFAGADAVPICGVSDAISPVHAHSAE